MPRTAAPQVQIFGRRDSRETQKALRFFKERRVSVSFVDVAIHPPAPGELRRFRERLGASALLDSNGAAFRDRGLAYLSMDDDEIVTRVLEDLRLLRLPLVRLGAETSIGVDEAAWKRWLSGSPSAAAKGR